MEKDILFSIIVPVYNTEKYVVKCLDSIKNAIKDDCEVIIVNDGSTDDSKKVINEYIEKLPEEYKSLFIYKEKPNKGLADTKNVGISLAKGKYISVIDSDDYISEDFYDIARRYINEGNEIIIYDLYVIFEKTPEYTYVARARVDKEEDMKKALISGAMQGSSCNKIIKKSLYEPYEFPTNKEYEDTSVTPFILMDTEKIKYIPYPLYYYLQREKSIVASNTYISAFYKICENISNELAKKDDFKKYHEVISEFFVRRMLEIMYVDYTLSKKTFKANMLNFFEHNKEVVNYMIENEMAYEDNQYSERQKAVLNNLLINCKNEDFSKIKKLFFARRLVAYVRRLLGQSVKLVKAVFGK